MANYKAYHLKGIALVELGKSETTTVKVKEGLEMLKTGNKQKIQLFYRFEKL